MLAVCAERNPAPICEKRVRKVKFIFGIELYMFRTGFLSIIRSLALYIQILIIKANEMHYFSVLFGTELCMFRTDLLSIIRSLNTVFTAICICHTNFC